MYLKLFTTKIMKTCSRGEGDYTLSCSVSVRSEPAPHYATWSQSNGAVGVWQEEITVWQRHAVVGFPKLSKGQNECSKTVKDEAGTALGMAHGLVAQVTMSSSSLFGAMHSHWTDCADERAVVTQSRTS